MIAQEQKTILLAEDQAFIALAEAQAISSFGYKVVTASSGETAVELATNNNKINLILMDIDLGMGIDGPAAARQILEKRNIPIVFLTSHSEKEYVDRVKEITRYGYIIKNSGDFVLKSSIEMAFELFEAHKKAREREERLQRAEIISGSGNWEFNLSTKIVFASEGAKRIYGLGDGEWTIDAVQKIPLPEYRSMLDAALRDLVQQGLPYDVEFEILRPSDNRRINIHSIAKFDPDRNVVAGTMQDITERTQAEDALYKSQTLLNEMGKIAKIGGWRVDVETQQVQWTEELYHIYEIDSSFVPTVEEVTEFYTPDSRQLVFQVRQRNIEFGEPYDIEVEIINAKGKRRWLRIIGRAGFTNGRITSRSGISQDITDRKLAEDARLESEEKYRQFIQYSNDPIFSFNPDETYRFVNEAFAKAFGKTPEQIVGKKPHAIFPHNEAEKHLALVRQVLQTGEKGEIEVKATASGEAKYFITQVDPIKDAQGNILWIAGISRDITERKRVEESLLQSQSLLNEMGKMAKVGAWEFDVETQQLQWTEELYHIYGVDSSFAPTLEKAIQLYTPDSRELIIQANQRLMEFGESYDIEVEILAPKGSRRWLRVIGRAGFTDGRITRRLGTSQDITEQKRAAEALASERTLIRTIIDSLPDRIYVKDLECRFLLNNTAHLSALGAARGADVRGLTDHDFRTPELADRYLADDREVLQSGLPLLNREEASMLPSGRQGWLLTFKTPLRDAEGKIFGLVGISRDITERKHAEENIKTLLAEKELLLKEVHHRIKNNMGTMMSLLSLQANTIHDSSTVTALKDAQNRLRSMEVLYDKLYRSENLWGITVNDYLPPLIKEIVNIFPNSAMVEIETKIDDFMLGVKELSSLGIIVNELLTNTMKHAFAGKEKGLITVSASKQGKRATIIIGDNGVGIPESVDIESSTGFGLMLVGTLTKQLQGSIRIERIMGTKFILEFET